MQAAAPFSSIWSALWPALAAALASTLGCAWLVLAPPGSGKPVALVFPPWWSCTQSYQAAVQDGAVIRFGLGCFIVIVAPDLSAPDAASDVWARLNPQALGGCDPRPYRSAQ